WSLVPILFFIPLRLPAWIVLGTWFVLQWLYSAGLAVTGGGEVAYLAHVLGFIVGVLAALPFRGGRRRPPVPRQATGFVEPPVIWRKTDRGGWR
ncbi:MAG: rhomboid family intramembrane serine protease, partial [Hamadaea sp.]|nr:rhomboid family intramembrane serine protease [Hamadaea sp.]